MTRTLRPLRRAAAAVLALALAGSALAGCSAQDDAETIRFAFNKREAIPFITKLVQEYNSSQHKVHVILDTSGTAATAAGFVRGNPPDISLVNYNNDTARFVQRCTLIDLSGTEAASRSRKDLQPLMDQYGSCKGRVSALPYSMMAASVIYNKAIFRQQGIEIPKTWDELLVACEKLKAAGITPFYGTFLDPWTVGQGLFDYAAGGQEDIIKFFDGLTKEGTDVGPNSDTSFQKNMTKPVKQMLELVKNYTNKDAASRTYDDGNLAFGKGEAAMYLQGPWAFSEIAKTAPDLDLGTFPLPMTNDPTDLKVRVNIDLAAWIPEASQHQDAARDFLEFLFRPRNIEAYNQSQSGFTPTTNAPEVTDPRIVGMKDYVENGDFYQGPSVLVPKTIPIFNYLQAIVLGGDPANTLSTMDADWARVARRQ